jgi:hypothetical protein
MSKIHIVDGGIEPGGGWEKFFKKMEFFKKNIFKKTGSGSLGSGSRGSGSGSQGSGSVLGGSGSVLGWIRIRFRVAHCMHKMVGLTEVSGSRTTQNGQLKTKWRSRWIGFPGEILMQKVSSRYADCSEKRNFLKTFKKTQNLLCLKFSASRFELSWNRKDKFFSCKSQNRSPYR